MGSFDREKLNEFLKDRRYFCLINRTSVVKKNSPFFLSPKPKTHTGRDSVKGDPSCDLGDWEVQITEVCITKSIGTLTLRQDQPWGHH